MNAVSRRTHAEAAAQRYRRASKREKGQILDSFCQDTGYHRTYAISLLRQPPTGDPVPRRRPGSGRPPAYGSEDVALVQACWEITDDISSKRLAPFLPELLDRLVALEALPDEVTPAVIQRVAGLSASSIDRLLALLRAREPFRRGRHLTKPGTLLKHQIPIRTFADSDDRRPGFLEIDLVAHCGSTGAGEFLFTLSTVDVATGWSACVGVRNKGEDAVFRAPWQLRAELPFPLLGIDSDNGSEFINHALVRYCQAEQKNWSVVHRLVGYDRLEGVAALGALNRLHAVARDFVNFFLPVLKLVDKHRDGARVRKHHDQAQTPYRRLLASGALTPTAQADLVARYQAAHPIRLKQTLEAAQQELHTHAVPVGTPLRRGSF